MRKKGYLEEGCDVGVDGTLYNVGRFSFPSKRLTFLFKKYPGFPQRIHQALVDVLGEKGKYVISGIYSNNGG